MSGQEATHQMDIKESGRWTYVNVGGRDMSVVQIGLDGAWEQDAFASVLYLALNILD